MRLILATSSPMAHCLKCLVLACDLAGWRLLLGLEISLWKGVYKHVHMCNVCMYIYMHMYMNVLHVLKDEKDESIYILTICCGSVLAGEDNMQLLQMRVTYVIISTLYVEAVLTHPST